MTHFPSVAITVTLLALAFASSSAAEDTAQAENSLVCTVKLSQASYLILEPAELLVTVKSLGTARCEARDSPLFVFFRPSDLGARATWRRRFRKHMNTIDVNAEWREDEQWLLFHGDREDFVCSAGNRIGLEPGQEITKTETVEYQVSWDSATLHDPKISADFELGRNHVLSEPGILAARADVGGVLSLESVLLTVVEPKGKDAVALKALWGTELPRFFAWTMAEKYHATAGVVKELAAFSVKYSGTTYGQFATMGQGFCWLTGVDGTKDFPRARQAFLEVWASGDPVRALRAAYYVGMCDRELNNRQAALDWFRKAAQEQSDPVTRYRAQYAIEHIDDTYHPSRYAR